MDVLQQNDLDYLFSKVAPSAEASSLHAPTSTVFAGSTTAATNASSTDLILNNSNNLSFSATSTSSSVGSAAPTLSQLLTQTIEVPAVDDTLAQQAAIAHAATHATLVTSTVAPLTTGAHISTINSINQAVQETVSGFENSAQLHKLFKTEDEPGSESGELAVLPAIFDLPPITALTSNTSPSTVKSASSSSPSTEYCTPASSPLSPNTMQEAESSESSPYQLTLQQQQQQQQHNSGSPFPGARKRSMDEAGINLPTSFAPVPTLDAFNTQAGRSLRSSLDNSTAATGANLDGTTSALSSSVSSPRSSFQDEVEPSQEQLEELYAMMEWSSDLRFRPAKRKRESKTKEARKKKHILSEQRRRNHMNEAIDTLKAYLPGHNPESPEAEPPAGQSKKTKVAVLKESTVFLSRLRELTLRLMSENKALTAENQGLKEQLKRLPFDMSQQQQAHHHQQQQAAAQSGFGGLSSHGMPQSLVYSTGPTTTTIMSGLPSVPSYYAPAPQVVHQQLDQRLNELRMQQLQQHQQQQQQQQPQQQQAQVVQVQVQTQAQMQPLAAQMQQSVPQLAPAFPVVQPQLSAAASAQQPKTDTFPMTLSAPSAGFADFQGLPFFSAQEAFGHVDQGLQQPQTTPVPGLIHRRFTVANLGSNAQPLHQQQQSSQQQQQQQQQQPPAVQLGGEGERGGFLSQHHSRLLFAVFFMIFVASSAPWEVLSFHGDAHGRGGSAAAPFTARGRVLLSTAEPADYWREMIGYLPGLVYWLKWLLLVTASYIGMILWRTSRVCHQFQKASHDLQSTDVFLKRGNMRQAESCSRDCLEHLGSPLPRGGVARCVMTAWELVRHVLHVIFIGRFIETVMMHARNDVAMSCMQARALSVFLRTHEKLDTEWLYAALTAFNTAQATRNLSLQAEVNLGIMLRLHGNPYLKGLFAPYMRYRSWLVARRAAAAGQEELLEWVVYGEAITSMCAGQLKQAARYLKQVRRRRGHDDEANTTLKRHATIYLALIRTLAGKPAAGRQLYRWVYEASLQGHDLVTLCLALLGLVRSLMATEELNEAQEALNVLARFPWKSLNRSDRILFRALQAYVHLRSGRIEPAFAIASGLHKEIREEETVRYHARFYSFLSYQALAEVSLGLYDELANKHNERLKGLVSSEEMEEMASASLMYVNMFAEAYPVNKPCALRCHAAYCYVKQGPSAAGKARYYCQRALATAREMKLRVEEERCQQALQKYLLADAISTV